MAEKNNFLKTDKRLEEGGEEVVIHPDQFRIDRDLLGHDEVVEMDFEATHKVSDRYGRDNAGPREPIAPEGDDEVGDEADADTTRKIRKMRAVEDVSLDVREVQDREAARVAEIRQKFRVDGKLTRDKVVYPRGYSTDGTNLNEVAEPVEQTEVVESGTLQGGREQISLSRARIGQKYGGDGARQPADKGHKYGPIWAKHKPRHASFVQKLKNIFAKSIDEAPSSIESDTDDKPEIGPDFAHDFFNGGFAILRVEELFPGLCNRRQMAQTEAEFQSLDADIKDITQYIRNVSLAVNNNPKLGVCIKNFAEAIYHFAKDHDAELKTSPEYSSPDDLLAKYLAYVCQGYNQKLNQTNFEQLIGMTWNDEAKRNRLKKELNEAVRSSLTDGLVKGFAVLEDLTPDKSVSKRELYYLISEVNESYLNDLYSATLETDEKAA